VMLKLVRSSTMFYRFSQIKALRPSANVNTMPQMKVVEAQKVSKVVANPPCIYTYTHPSYRSDQSRRA
jgi:hypothetical protein